MKLKLNDSVQNALNRLKDTLRKTEAVLHRNADAGGEASSTDATA